MAGGNSKKPIVFVFGAQKDDPDGRKRNLSAINTAVAYRAHEQRRAKKSKQKAQAGGVNEHSKEPTSAAPKQIEKDSKSSSPQRASQLIFNQYGEDGTSAIESPFSQRESPPNAKLLRVDTGASSETPPLKQEYDEFSESSSASESGSRGTEVLSTPSCSELQLTPSTETGTSAAPFPLNSYFQSSLDPFFVLPQVVTERERWMVQYYFQEMGHIGFGTHRAALFCPDRDWVAGYVCSKPLCLQWILIHAEEHLVNIGASPAPTASETVATSLISRKAQAYNSLSHALKTSRQDVNRALTGIMYAAILDYKNVSMHLAALDKLLDSSGGFEGFLQRPIDTVQPEHIATVYAFGACPISYINDVRSVRDRTFHDLRRIHARVQRVRDDVRRLRNKRPWDSLFRAHTDSNGTLVSSSVDEHLRYYIKAQSDSLRHECIRPLIDIPYDAHSHFSVQARHFALLLQTHAILLEFDDTHHDKGGANDSANATTYWASATFHRRLQHIALKSTARHVKTGEAQLTSGGLLLVNSFVRQEVQTYVNRGEVLARGARVSQVMVDGIKTFTLLGDRSRATMIEWLRDGLRLEAGDHFDTLATRNDEEVLQQMAVEVERNWMSQQVTSPGG